MKIKEKDELKALYELYGFEIYEETEEYIVFTFSNGYFYNCEIMNLGMAEVDSRRIKDEFRKLGYSVRNLEYKSIECVHRALFQGFFDMEKNKKRQKMQYKKFCDVQSERIVSINESDKVYEYVSGKFYDGNVEKDGGIVEEIIEKMQQDGAQLVILEAAAGFGKTCTSYEVLNQLANNNVTIFIELSKNRNVKIFRYVLLDAIDKNFSYLSSKVVQEEIKNGNIPLIVDGFDELLSTLNQEEIQKKVDDNISDAQTMLDTIAELLGEKSSAKILLTSRKSSIFTGDKFDEWTLQKLGNCEVARYTLEEPTLEKWLGKEKIEYIQKNNIPFYGINNPIMLTLYRNMKYEDFVNKCTNSDSVLGEYFENIMKREQTRQSLLLQPSEQYEIMTSFAAELVDLGISSDEVGLIKDVFEMIMATHLEEYLLRYEDTDYVEERPKADEFVRKLVHHALLDRKSYSQLLIGFVNDFVFGIFIGEAFLKDLILANKVANKYIELAVTAFAIKGKERKEQLFDKLKVAFSKLQIEERLLIDINLKGITTSNYEGGYIDAFTFSKEFKFNEVYSFENICFSHCIFESLKLNMKCFQNCQFIECQFIECEFQYSITNNIQFIACEGIDSFKLIADEYVGQDASSKNYKKIVLEQYWRPGRANADPKHTYRTLLKGLTTSEYHFVDLAIKELKNEGILFTKGGYLVLNLKKISEIKELLGRG